MNRKIIHIDMDCFFAAVEMRDNPRWQASPLAVGGDSRRGVIATANYAARRFGVRSAMPTHQALTLCPQLVLVRPRMERYREVSHQVREIFHEFTERVEPLSLDEAYLDVSDSHWHQGSATRIAEAIRQRITQRTGLTASAGVASNKFLAKIASEQNKPDGLFVIRPEQSTSFAAALPLRAIPGVGPKTAAKLEQLGLHRACDLLRYDPLRLTELLGSFALTLRERAQGIDERPVEISRERKSIGVERTLEYDLTQLEAAQQLLQEQLLPALQQRLGSPLPSIRGQTLKLRFNDFQSTTVTQAGQLWESTRFLELLGRAWLRRQNRSIRLIGISVSLAHHDAQQLAFPW